MTSRITPELGGCFPANANVVQTRSASVIQTQRGRQCWVQARKPRWRVLAGSRRSGGGEPRRVSAPEAFRVPPISCFEEPDSGSAGTLVVDSIYYSEVCAVRSRQGRGFPLRLVRFYSACRSAVAPVKLPTHRSGQWRGQHRAAGSSAAGEFRHGESLRVGAGKASWAWMAVTEVETGNAPLQPSKRIQPRTTASRRLLERRSSGFVSEPVMVPRPGATAERRTAG